MGAGAATGKLDPQVLPPGHAEPGRGVLAAEHGGWGEGMGGSVGTCCCCYCCCCCSLPVLFLSDLLQEQRMVVTDAPMARGILEGLARHGLY